MTRTQINFIMIAQRLRVEEEERFREDVEREAMFQAMKEG
jgi:hypothetical protein